MALTPFRGFYDMQSEMNRMFDEVFGSLARTGRRQQGEAPTQWARRSTCSRRMATSWFGPSCLVSSRRTWTSRSRTGF